MWNRRSAVSVARGSGQGGVLLDFGNFLRDWISTLEFYKQCVSGCATAYYQLTCKLHMPGVSTGRMPGSNVQRPTSVMIVSQLWSVELRLRALVVYPPRALAAAASAMPCLQARHACTYPETHAINPSAFASSNARRAAALGQMLVLVKVRHVFLLGQVLFERREVAQLVQLVGATGRAGLLLHR